MYELIEPVVIDMGFELVQVARIGRDGSTLQVMCEPLDEGRPMSVDDCADISHAVSAVLDVADPLPSAYTLEVSSPGVERPLTKIAHYRRFAGQLAKVEIDPPLEGRRRFVGVIGAVEDDRIDLELEDATAKLAFATIKKAKLVMAPEPAKRRRGGRAR